MTQVCTRCVMDTTARDITFDVEGQCNYCTEFLARAGGELFKDPEERQAELELLVGRLKREGRGKPYDCIMGLSGGVDSSSAIIKAISLGLRPLAVHMDNGWNSELAQSNIENLVRGLGVDLVTYVIDWREYRALMQAFFAADVIDIELLYDNAMYAVNYQQARHWRTRWILAGTNLATEGMRIPSSWNWLKYDKRNIKALRRSYDGGTLTSFPAIGALGYSWNLFARRVQWVSFLDYFEFNKAEAIAELQRDFNYKPYPHKHYESVFTRLYMGHILPTKFDVDMRKVDYSNLIVSGQMTREEALRLLADPPYPSPAELDRDIAYFQKKLGWTPEEWSAYLSRPERSHEEFASERGLYTGIRDLSRRFRPASAR
jgi:N-acetyl sugar amidotransferase